MSGFVTNYIEFLKGDEVHLERKNLGTEDLSELEVVRYFTNLSRINWAVDVGFYPLGSCTMKYNPKINDYISNIFSGVHPLVDVEEVQGILGLIKEFEEKLKYLLGMDAVSFLPAAGAHGEYTALLIARKYFQKLNEERDTVLVPDSAHGTNPASAAMAGFKVVTIKSNDKGQIDLEDLKSKINQKVAVFMITNPNTLGIYEKEIDKITAICKGYGVLSYYDGANFNAVIGKIRPGDMGFDMMHLNLHKTFSTPHGSGGPGAGPIAVKNFLKPFLPVPIVDYHDNKYFLN
ncbi:MAG: aminotransferase class V-fold PLP-dependent enzyme, partial [bacterium]